MDPLTFRIQSSSQQNSTIIFPFVKGKPERAMGDFNRTHDFRRKVMSNFRYLLFVKGDEAFRSRRLCDYVLYFLDEHLFVFL